MADSRASAVAKVVVMAALFGIILFGFLPFWLGLFRPMLDFRGAHALRLLGLILLVPGAIVGLSCVFNFAWTGHGTPAPLDPPKHLVVRGFYAYVRNPMYVGFGAAIIGAWITFWTWQLPVAMGALALAVGIHLFVVYYEEPTLRRMFGSEYVDFCRNVPRWIPRVQGWRPPKAALA